MNKFILFFLLTISLSAQVKGVVKDSISGKPIPYVNIWVENENIGTTSEEDGSFSIDLKEDKKLVFSSMGYNVKTISSKNIEPVLLVQKIYEMPEIVVSAPKRTEEIEIGNYQSYGFRWGVGNINSAVYFESTEEIQNHPFLKEIKFHTKSEIQNAKIRVNFLRVNSDNSPGESLLDEEIIVEVKKGNNKNIIDFSKYNFKFPKNGFFISFEKIDIEENKHYYEVNYKDQNGNKKILKGMSIEPDLCFVPEEKDIVWESSIYGKWKKSNKQILEKPKSYENLLMKKYHNKYLMPSLSITLSN